MRSQLRLQRRRPSTALFYLLVLRRRLHLDYRGRRGQVMSPTAASCRVWPRRWRNHERRIASVPLAWHSPHRVLRGTVARLRRLFNAGQEDPRRATTVVALRSSSEAPQQPRGEAVSIDFTKVDGRVPLVAIAWPRLHVHAIPQGLRDQAPRDTGGELAPLPEVLVLLSRTRSPAVSPPETRRSQCRGILHGEPRPPSLGDGPRPPAESTAARKRSARSPQQHSTVSA
mmetsp:Transcript_13010/g.37438  ORF Transcript_13010/g.37438 Transcript_13010/m.37438 type:complete len:228 (+) Transcript_13010:713-1396(+)